MSHHVSLCLYAPIFALAVFTNLLFSYLFIIFNDRYYKKLSYCWETAQCESKTNIAEMDVEMTT